MEFVMSHPTQPSIGFFVPQMLLLDERLTPLERNAWLAFRSLAEGDGTVAASYESLRPFLPSSPGSHRAAQETVARAVLCLRLTTWIELVQYRRNPLTGLSLPTRYAVRTEPLPFVEACLADTDYLLLIERALGHTSVTVRQLAQGILSEALRHPGPLARLPIEMREHVKRLYRPRRDEGTDPDDSGGDSASAESIEKEADASTPISTAPGIPKRATPLPTTVRTVKSNVLKEVRTHNTEQQPLASSEMPRCRSAAPTRFLQLTDSQRRYLMGRLQTLRTEQRRDVLDEWDVRCAAGQVKSAFAYLCGLIQKALEGTFLLWAARKLMPNQATANVSSKATPSSVEMKAAPAGTGKASSPEVVNRHLETIRKVLNAPTPIRQVLGDMVQRGMLPRSPERLSATP
jgi:hypothetical protein